jgi:hypothetical protein
MLDLSTSDNLPEIVLHHPSTNNYVAQTNVKVLTRGSAANAHHEAKINRCKGAGKISQDVHRVVRSILIGWQTRNGDIVAPYSAKYIGIGVVFLPGQEFMDVVQHSSGCDHFFW